MARNYPHTKAAAAIKRGVNRKGAPAQGSGGSGASSKATQAGRGSTKGYPAKTHGSSGSLANPVQPPARFGGKGK